MSDDAPVPAAAPAAPVLPAAAAAADTADAPAAVDDPPSSQPSNGAGRYSVLTRASPALCDTLLSMIEDSKSSGGNLADNNVTVLKKKMGAAAVEALSAARGPEALKSFWHRNKHSPATLEKYAEEGKEYQLSQAAAAAAGAGGGSGNEGGEVPNVNADADRGSSAEDGIQQVGAPGGTSGSTADADELLSEALDGAAFDGLLGGAPADDVDGIGGGGGGGGGVMPMPPNAVDDDEGYPPPPPLLPALPLGGVGAGMRMHGMPPIGGGEESDEVLRLRLELEVAQSQIRAHDGVRRRLVVAESVICENELEEAYRVRLWQEEEQQQQQQGHMPDEYEEEGEEEEDLHIHLNDDSDDNGAIDDGCARVRASDGADGSNDYDSNVGGGDGDGRDGGIVSSAKKKKKKARKQQRQEQGKQRRELMETDGNAGSPGAGMVAHMFDADAVVDGGQGVRIATVPGDGGKQNGDGDKPTPVALLMHALVQVKQLEEKFNILERGLDQGLDCVHDNIEGTVNFIDGRVSDILKQLGGLFGKTQELSARVAQVERGEVKKKLEDILAVALELNELTETTNTANEISERVAYLVSTLKRMTKDQASAACDAGIDDKTSMSQLSFSGGGDIGERASRKSMSGQSDKKVG